MEKPSETMKQAILNSKLKTVQELLEFLSVDAVYNLLKNCSGCTISLPKYESFLKPERNERIKKDFYDGLTYNQLCKKYNLSNRHVRLIINDNE